MNSNLRSAPLGGESYGQRTASDYIQHIDPAVLHSLSEAQLMEIERVIELAIPRPTPKIVDLRFVVDLILSRFYVVLFVGKDRRRQRRRHSVSDPITRAGNLVAVVLLLLGSNLLISATLVIILYLIKSALGIDLTPGHSSDNLERILR